MLTPLSIKTNYSESDSMVSIDTLVIRASQLGFDAIGVADFDNIFKINTFYQMCKSKGIKGIVGTELRMDKGNLIIVVKNQKGYYNLAEIILKRDLGEFSFDTLVKYQEGLAFVLPMMESEIKPHMNVECVILK